MWLLIGVGLFALAGWGAWAVSTSAEVPTGVITAMFVFPWCIAAWIIPFAKRPQTCKDAATVTTVVVSAIACLLTIPFFFGFCGVIVFAAWQVGAPAWAMWSWAVDRAERLTYGPPAPVTPKHLPCRTNDVATILIGIVIPLVCILCLPLTHFRARFATIGDYFTFILFDVIGLVIAFGIAAIGIRLARRASLCRAIPAILTTAAASTTVGLLINWWFHNRDESGALEEFIGLMVLCAWQIGMPALAMILWSRRRARRLAVCRTNRSAE
jgi:hypothetical protein